MIQHKRSDRNQHRTARAGRSHDNRVIRIAVLTPNQRTPLFQPHNPGLMPVQLPLNPLQPDIHLIQPPIDIALKLPEPAADIVESAIDLLESAIDIAPQIVKSLILRPGSDPDRGYQRNHDR
jgi:hypothetical protein